MDPVGEARMPIFASGLPVVRPASPRSSTKGRIPPSSSRAKTTKTSAMGALVMKDFSPLKEKPASLRRAVVRSAKASEPASGSVSAQQPILEKPSTGAAKRSRCAGVPRRSSDWPHRPRLAPNESANPGSARVSSCRSVPVSSGVAKRPPFAAGSCAASRASSDKPSESASSRITARSGSGPPGAPPSCSSSAARGSRRSRAKVRAMPRASSSSPSMVSGTPYDGLRMVSPKLYYCFCSFSAFLAAFLFLWCWTSAPPAAPTAAPFLPPTTAPPAPPTIAPLALLWCFSAGWAVPCWLVSSASTAVALVVRTKMALRIADPMRTLFETWDMEASSGKADHRRNMAQRLESRAVSDTPNPKTPREARRMERLKLGPRPGADGRPKARPAVQRRPPPVLGAIAGSTSDEPTVTLSKRAVERLDQGHVWIYRSDIAAPETLAGGEVVRLADERGWFVGKAFYGAQSQIAVRLLSREDEPIDEEFFARRLARAIALRDAIQPDPERRRAGRIVHGEADLLPGLVVDRYADCLTVQTLIEATDARRDLFAALLENALRPRAIVERNDVKVRAYEGLAQRKGVLRGTAPGPVEFAEGEVRLVADLLEGQKTGAFLDQAENRIEAGRYARGRALDCFTYGGAFALQLARRAEKVTAVDISEQAAAQGREAAARNGTTNLEFKVANAFDLLREESARGERYDTIVLDPPAFAKNKASLDAALRGYKEINLRAFHLLERGGVLVTCSCSFHIDDETFERTVLQAATDAKRTAQVVERRGAARDHPTLLGVPETRYLKCLILRVP